MTAEELRLQEASAGKAEWKFWGPYLSERQWGTVREDYSDTGNAWDYFTHDQARSRAYRWGEDGLGGLSDEQQRLCFGLCLWNGRDPILKERLFGLTNSEGNHGEDVKEYYFYLDSTPTHSYMKYLYKYPQAAFPYDDLVKTNRERTRLEMEYELIDTGVFDGDRYFDVVLEYAKASPSDVLIRVSVHNRGDEPALLHLLPNFWFRNTWTHYPNTPRPALRGKLQGPVKTITANHFELGEYHLHCEGAERLLFTENETNNERLFQTANTAPFVKDAFHRYLVNGQQDAVNPGMEGTKAAAYWGLLIPARASKTVRLRLTRQPDPAFEDFDALLGQRLREADEFYNAVTPDNLDEDQHRVIRQALAGMLWTKQFYLFDLDRWLEEHSAWQSGFVPQRRVRNLEWYHMVNHDIISMPDKWEYPWYAAWDLAFHTTALAMVDVEFAKQQLDLMLREVYLHPNGQIPAYEWNFGDVNPPVHAWATVFVYSHEKSLKGQGDVQFLKSSFQKLLLNFTWWVNRKDPAGRNVFQGGFLGLDNIGVFDRSSPLPTGGHLEQADGTAWMVLFTQNMLEMAWELALDDPIYEGIAYKFLEHYFWIASSMDRVGVQHDEMWDEQDGFFYDLLRLPDGSATRLKVRSMVGLLPLCATTVFPKDYVDRFPESMERIRAFLARHPEVTATINPPAKPGVDGRRLLSVLDERKLRRVLDRLLDPAEFLSDYGIRSLSKVHEENPFVFRVHGEEYRVSYLPAESDSGMFGGNSNWRGPIWMPVNLLIIRALLQAYLYYGNEFQVECPKGSGQKMNLFEVAREISNRLSRIFLRNTEGRRPVFGGAEKFQTDPYWRDCLLFYEYFHGDNGAGLGASHQTGWTGVVARLMQLFGHADPEQMLRSGDTRPITRGYRD